MANLKSIMIDSLRGGTELDTVWRLRKSFLEKNINVHDSNDYKDHLMHLSNCFVDTALGWSCNYPPKIIQEMRSRSVGLEDSIRRAMFEMEDTSYQFAQSSAAAAASSYYDKQNIEIPYDYSQEQDSQQNSYSYYDQGQQRTGFSSRSKARRQGSFSSYDQDQYHGFGSYGRQGQYDVGAYRQRNSKGKGPAFPRKANLKESMIDSNALSVIPAKKGHPNQGVPREKSKSALKKKKHKNAVKNAMKSELSSNFVPSDAGAKTKGKDVVSNTLNCKHLESCYKPQPLFEFIKNIPTTTEASGNDDKDQNSEQGGLVPPGLNEVLDPRNTSSALEGNDPNPDQDPPPDAKDDDVILENSKELKPILDLAHFYSKMDKGSLNPFATLQRCAAGANQRIRSVSKSSINSEGFKEFTCQIFVNDVNLVSTVITPGTPPLEAKKKLASIVLEKLAQPHLRLVLDNEGGLTLDTSNTPFVSGTSKQQKNTVQKSPQDKAPTLSTKASNPSLLTDDFKVKSFDSYIAWRCEEHPMLKMVRQLGHMYVTLPFKETNNPAVILQLLANVSGIRLEIKDIGTGNSSICKDKYSMVMEEKVVLVSWNKLPEDPAGYISQSVLRKISMPYLCLEDDFLYASQKPFNKNSTGLDTNDKVVLDTWQKDVNGKITAKIPKPVRLDDFCILQSVDTHRPDTIKQSAELCQKRLVTMQTLSSDKKIRYSYLKINRKVIGGVQNRTGHSIVNPMAECSKNCLQVLRKCHWTIRTQKLMREEKYVYASHVMPYLPRSKQTIGQTETKGLEKSNKGHQLLAKMGWSGGGIGRREDGIQEPISSSELLSSKSEMGFKKAAGPSNISKLTDSSKVSNCDLVMAYNKSPFHSDLYLPCPFASERGKIFREAERLGMRASTRGIQKNKRVLVMKNFTAAMIVNDCLKLGGKSELYDLIPPQEVADFDNQVEDYIQADNAMNSKSVAGRGAKTNLLKFGSNAGGAKVQTMGIKSKTDSLMQETVETNTSTAQCNLLKGPPLEKFQPLNKLCEIVYELENCDGDEDRASISDGDYEDGYEDEVSFYNEGDYSYMDEEAGFGDEEEEQSQWMDDPSDRKRKSGADFDNAKGFKKSKTK